MPARPLALVTGATGFVATEVVLALLDAGFDVRGTCRSQDKANAWSRANPAAKIEWTLVENIEAKGAFDEAVKGVSHIAHVASPFHYNATDDPVGKMLGPALDGTLSILRSASSEPSVERVVITSSFAAIRNLPLLETEPTHNFTEADWNPTTWDQAAAMTDPAQGGALYAASKGIAERGAWDWLKEAKPRFALTCLNPPIIYGPPKQAVAAMKDLNTSVANLWRLVDAKEVPVTGLPPYVDNRDLAQAHVLALTKDEAKGERFVITPGQATWDNAVRIVMAALPEYAARFPKPNLERGSGIQYTLDSTKASKALGMTYRSEEDTIVDTYRRLFELEKQLGSK